MQSRGVNISRGTVVSRGISFVLGEYIDIIPLFLCRRRVFSNAGEYGNTIRIIFVF